MMLHCKQIIGMFMKKWRILLLLIPSSVIAYVVSLMFGFYIANLYHDDSLGVSIMKLVFAVVAPLPIAVYWKDIFAIVKSKIIALTVCMLLQVSLVGLFWLLINSL